ncbi:MAG: DUF6090 family protein [Saprospiraceae bacterium]
MGKLKFNKASIKYVIGEIIIVSIGILIAFGINTYSSGLSKDKKHKEYKNSLIVDINENIKNIDRIQKVQKLKVVELNSIVQMIGQTTMDYDSISTLLYRQRKSPTFFPVSGTFKSLVSIGEFGNFSTELKRRLFNLYDANYERTVYNGQLYDNIYVDVYDKEIRDIMDFSSMKIENKERLKSKEFAKNIRQIIDEAQSYISLIGKSKSESKQLLELIDSSK